MKKILAIAALAAVALSGSAFAQNSSSASSSVTSTVQVPIQILNQQGLNFGSNLARTVNTTIAPTSTQSARFFVLGDAGDNVSFNVDPVVVLLIDPYVNAQALAGVNAVGGQSTTMNVTTSATIRHINDAATSIPIIPNPYPLSTPGPGGNDGGAQAAGNGQMYVYVGGSVTPSATQQRGSYSGVLNVAVNYAN
jgi:hypothetical protein